MQIDSVRDAKISVVIATLGGDSLQSTIQSLLESSLPPSDILICTPVDFIERVKPYENGIVKVIATEVKGQVRQRAIGFTKTTNPLVMQLDDDIIMDKDAIEKLTTHLFNLGKGNAIGPVFYGKTTNACIYRGQTGFFKNIFDSVICLSRWGKNKMGTVTKIGINFGIDDSLEEKELIETQWLPGGCVLSFKEDLITHDFFPFDGKAYCEDVYHSWYRKQANTKMWIATRIKAIIDVPEPEFGKQAVDKVIRIRKRYVDMIKGPQWRLSLYEWFCRIRSRIYG